jgi:uncharacterized BrkB/YihY/UPF0761 family membrane protein
VAAAAIGIVAGVLSSILPLALNGESVPESGGGGTLLGVISLVSIIACCLVLFALWRWVFSPNAHKRRGKGPSE